MTTGQGTLDIGWNNPGPGGVLSNFMPRPFILDGVACGGMEGFLQGLKFADPAEQRRVCALHGEAAKAAGTGQLWQVTGLWWRGEAIDRHGPGYQALLDRAYAAIAAADPAFRAALQETGDAILTHVVGKDDPRETVLTRDEFCLRMTRLRDAARSPRAGGRGRP